MRMYDIIAKKRDGAKLSKQEIEFFVNGYVKGTIPDYQVSALLMAIYLLGMTDEETVNLTKAMAYSGDTVDLSAFGSLSVDKHSTGGVGDKTTLIISPIVAAAGCKVTKMSGRGLGFTGGTIDKLEAIPNYKTQLSREQFFSQVEKLGMAVISQTGNLTPADKKLYALRDVTATVESIPLITSSVMSKKIAAGAANIVLDVKYGSGAFMKTAEAAEALAKNMVSIGKLCGRKVAALITNMNSPLGSAVGNTLEVIEAVEVLCGRVKGQLRDICISLAGNMISLSLGISEQDGMKMATEVLDSGKAFDTMRSWIIAQGGDISCIDNTELFEVAPYKLEIKSESSGYITQMDTQKIGAVCCALGAGRAVKDDKIDMSAGIIIAAKTGDKVSAGDTLATLYTSDKSLLDIAAENYVSAVEIGDQKPTLEPLIYKIIR